MKFYYQKYDDTIQYLSNDKVDGWQPSSEDIEIEICGEQLVLQTTYQSGYVASMEMTVIENNNRRLIAQHFDKNMGITVFVQGKEKDAEATLTLMNSEYIVGRYLKKVTELPE